MSDGNHKDRSEEIIGGCRELGLEALIVIGGDGSLAILRKLAQQGGLDIVGIPKTIDNDVGMTETSVGFDTAVTVATEALDRLQPTAASHARVMVLEVMGRDAGHIALYAGIAGGADVILMPEIPYSIEGIAAKIDRVRKIGRNFALVVVSEAVKTLGGRALQKEYHGGEKRFGGIGDYLSEAIAAATGAESRVTVLGHVQRGSSPSWRDRLLATTFGVHAVDLIAAGKFDRMVAWSNRQVVDVPLEKAIAHYQAVELDGSMVKTARGLGIYIGDETDA
jgi:6-phosphofructokinase 1